MIFSFEFGLVLAILRRFQSLCVVFGHKTTATSCKVADFFSSYYIYKIDRQWLAEEVMENAGCRDAPHHKF